jgi:hypothetical protein
MSVRVTIETASKAEAELIATLLEPAAKAETWHGYGVIRLVLRGDAETAAVIETVAEGVERHELPWARVRFGDDERVFRGNGRHRPGHEQEQQSPSSTAASPPPRPSLTELVADWTRDWPSTAASVRLHNET